MVRVNATLEEWIRDRPEQWLWVHRRWPDCCKRHSGPENWLSNAKISTTRRRMRSTLGTIHFATAMTTEWIVFGRDEQREDLQ
jgi:hypothetical protein